MKKTILAQSALALAIAATTSVPTFAAMGDEPDLIGVTGRFRTALECGEDTCDVRDLSSRFRFNAEEDLGNGNTVFGRFEFAASTADGKIGTGDAQRLAYVGIKGGFGELSLGTRWSPFYNVVTSPVDFTQGYGGTWGEQVGYKGAFRENHGVFYKVGGFQAMVKMDSDSVDPDSPDGPDDVDFDVWELGYTFDLGGVSLGLAARDEEYEEETLFGVNVNTDVGGTRLSLSYYTQADIDLSDIDSVSDLDEVDDSGTVGDFSGILAQVVMPVGAGKLSLSYGKDDTDGDATEGEMIALEYEQMMSSNSRWFVGAESYDTDEEGVSDDTRYGVGIRYDF